MREIRVLIWPYSTEIGLELYNSLAFCKEFRLFGAGQSLDDLGCTDYESVTYLPPVTTVTTALLNEVVSKYSIDVVYPAHDDIVVFLAQHSSDINCLIVAPDIEMARVLRDKETTYHYLSGVVPVPSLITKVDSGVRFPLFTKPKIGQGSVGARLVIDETDALSVLADSSMLLMEYLPGSEYTVDCFSDSDGDLLFSSPRRRIKQRNGIAVITEAVPNAECSDLASCISRRLRLRGAWFVQCRYSAAGKLTVLEVANRIAGSMVVTRNRGVNLPQLSLFQLFGLQLTVMPLDVYPCIERTLNRKQVNPIPVNCLLVDYDDTLIIRNEINYGLVGTIALLRSKGVRIVLVSRHNGDLVAAVSRVRLSWLFDDIEHLTKGQPKSAYARSGVTVLIDDSFKERMEFCLNTGGIAIDSTMIGLLGA